MHDNEENKNHLYFTKVPPQKGLREPLLLMRPTCFKKIKPLLTRFASWISPAKGTRSPQFGPRRQFSKPGWLCRTWGGKLAMTLNTDFVKVHPTRSKLLHCAGNLPAVCGRHSGSTCGLGSCSGAGACTVAVVPTYVVSRTFLSAGYPKRKDRDSIGLMNTYHRSGCCTMELSSHSKRLAVIAIFLDLY